MTTNDLPQTPTQMTSLRAPTALLERADALRERQGEVTGVTPSRSELLRVALEAGLTQLESRLRSATGGSGR